MIRGFLVHDLVLNIYNFKVFGSIKKNKTSYFLLKKCEFGDYHELDTIKKFSKKNKIIFFDCGCNYGFYSFYVASLSAKNRVFAIEASKQTSKDFLKNLDLNKLSNITFLNNAISNIDDENILFNESENDWESSQTHKNFKLSSISGFSIMSGTRPIDTKSSFLAPLLDPNTSKSLVSVVNSSFCEVIRCHLNLNFIAGENSYSIFSHLTSSMCNYFVPILEFNPKSCVWKKLLY